MKGKYGYYYDTDTKQVLHLAVITGTHALRLAERDNLTLHANPIDDGGVVTALANMKTKYAVQFTQDGKTWHPYTDLMFGCDTNHEFDDKDDADSFAKVETERLGEGGYVFEAIEVVSL